MCNPCSVVFLVKSWHDSMLSLQAQRAVYTTEFVEGLGPHNKLYLKFVVSELLKLQAWVDLGDLPAILLKFGRDFPGLVPQLAD